MQCSGTITVKTPALIIHHVTSTPLSLTYLLDCCSVLVKPFSVFITEVSHIIWKVFQVTMGIMYLDARITLKFVKTGPYIFIHGTATVCFFVLTFTNDRHRCPKYRFSQPRSSTLE